MDTQQEGTQQDSGDPIARIQGTRQQISRRRQGGAAQPDGAVEPAVGREAAMLGVTADRKRRHDAEEQRQAKVGSSTGPLVPLYLCYQHLPYLLVTLPHTGRCPVLNFMPLSLAV